MRHRQSQAWREAYVTYRTVRAELMNMSSMSPLVGTTYDRLNDACTVLIQLENLKRFGGK